MNLVGKIFTVLIFMLSLIFMTMAIMVYATNRNLRETVTKPGGLSPQWEKLEKDKENLKTDKVNLQNQIEKVKSEKLNALSALQFRLVELDDQIKQRVQEKVKLTDAEFQAVKTVQATQEDAQKLREEVEGLRQKIAEAQAKRDTNLREVQRLTDELHNLVNEFQTLKERQRTLSADLLKTQGK
jgi:chromosome segregation ATPase